MRNDPPPRPPVSSFLLNLALGVIAILPAIPAPRADLPSLDTPLGRLLYIVSVALVVGALIHAWTREEKRTAWELAQRDSEAESRYQATLANQREESDRIIAFMTQAASARTVIAQTGAVGMPLLTAIDASGSLVTQVYADRQRHVAAITAMQGHPGPTGPADLPHLPEATALLQEITQNPPTEPNAVRDAAARLRHYVMKVDTGEYLLVGNEVRLIHRDKDGNVIGER